MGVATKGAMNKLDPPRVLSLIQDVCFYGFRDVRLRRLFFLESVSIFGMVSLILRIYGNFAYRDLSIPFRLSEPLLQLFDIVCLVLYIRLLCIVWI